LNKRRIKVVFEQETEGTYKQLVKDVTDERKKGVGNSDNQRLLKSIDYGVERLKMTPMAGVQIQRTLIPAVYLHKYEIDNLWKIDLVNYWRMLYTIKGDKIEIMCLILDIVDHGRYDKIFGYKTNALTPVSLRKFSYKGVFDQLLRIRPAVLVALYLSCTRPGGLRCPCAP
jgi:hypothetical protein